MEKPTIEEITIFCKKKGFIFQNSEIYGGFAGFFDYGPLGVELKNNIKREWWKTFVHQRNDVVGIDGTIITHPKVWEASGHVSSFKDVMVQCSKCKSNFRADFLVEEQLHTKTEGLKKEDLDKLIEKNKLICPHCKGKLSKAYNFNLMFKTNVGPIESESSISYLRPETAQLIFTNFKLVEESSRLKLPFGIAQIGKAFRNEISPRDFLFRTREFEQMEIEYFINPNKLNCPYLTNKNFKFNILTAKNQQANKTQEILTSNQILEKNLANEWHVYWIQEQYKWFLDLGIKKENLRLREHLKDELSHYSSATFDIEYNFPIGWKELYGNANRQDFDLKQHELFSKKNLKYFDEETKTKFIPHVIEPSQGLDRAFLTFLIDAYEYDKKRENIVLHLHPRLAPIKLGIFPLVNKLNEEAKKIYEILKKEFTCYLDESGSVGRRYARADEISIPFCITIDFDCKKNKDITIRNREDTKQIRVKEKDMVDTIKRLLNKEIEFEKAGKLIN